MTDTPARIRGRVFAAASIATLALFGAASVATADAAVASASPPSTAHVIAADDDTSAPPGDTGGGVNDQGQNSGDVFTQNAQDQSTA